MTERIDNLISHVQVLDEKLDHLNERFDAVDAALREQREYTEFGLTRLEATLEAKMDTGFFRIERKLDQFIDAQIQTNALVDRRLTRLER